MALIDDYMCFPDITLTTDCSLSKLHGKQVTAYPCSWRSSYQYAALADDR